MSWATWGEGKGPVTGKEGFGDSQTTIVGRGLLVGHHPHKLRFAFSRPVFFSMVQYTNCVDFIKSQNYLSQNLVRFPADPGFIPR